MDRATAPALTRPATIDKERLQQLIDLLARYNLDEPCAGDGDLAIRLRACLQEVHA